MQRATYPESCFGCEHLHFHCSVEKEFSGGCIKSLGNYYCTGIRKHKKITKTNVYKTRPGFCPLAEESPARVDTGDE